MKTFSQFVEAVQVNETAKYTDQLAAKYSIDMAPILAKCLDQAIAEEKNPERHEKLVMLREGPMMDNIGRGVGNFIGGVKHAFAQGQQAYANYGADLHTQLTNAFTQILKQNGVPDNQIDTIVQNSLKSVLQQIPNNQAAGTGNQSLVTPGTPGTAQTPATTPAQPAAPVLQPARFTTSPTSGDSNSSGTGSTSTSGTATAV